MPFGFSGRRSRQNKMGPVIAMIAGVVAASSGALNRFVARGLKPHVGDFGSMTTWLIFGAAIAIPLVIILIVRLTRNGDDDDARSANMNTSERDDAQCDDEYRGPRVLALAAALVAIAIAFFFVFFAQPVRAQGSPERGAFVVMNGADTMIVDRFSWTADTLRGTVAMKGQARVDYVVALGPQYTVRTMAIKQFRWGAAAGDAPSAEVTATLQGDSVIFLVGGITTRLATKPGAVPSFNNAFAIGELFTRRARSSGGSGDYFYLALNGGVTLPVTVRPAGTDSSVFAIAGQQERFKVDAAGRILGGSVVGQPAIITRVLEAEAAKITFGMVPLKPSEKPDYSAPRGAPYTAEEVSFKGPGGITLGGTLTKPASARGPLPAVVTITGSGQQDRDEYIPLVGGVRIFRQVADTLSRVGIAVLRLDDRGLGASTGSFLASTTADFADDIRAALAYLRTRTDIDPNRLALVGHSEGGMIAPMVAATDPELRAIAIMAGPADKMLDIILSQNKWVADHNPKFTQAQRDSVLAEARVMLAPEKQITPAVKFWTSYDPAPVAKKVKASTLILQGATDRQVPVENANKLAALIRSGGNKDVSVRIFPATDHLFLADSTGDFLDMYKHVQTNKVSPVILGALADWMVVKLGAPPTVK
jgi:dienelactone hydrolase